MRDQPPAPPPKAQVDPFIYAVLATFLALLMFGLIFNWLAMYAVGGIGLFLSVAIYFLCPPMNYTRVEEDS
jgi:hypothetical protein